MKSKQLGINLFTNILAMIFSLGINFLITPILIDQLGLSAYGYIGIISNLISFFTVITYTLNSMVGRFYTIEYRKSNFKEANEYISTALYSCIILALFLLPIIFISTVFLDKIIVIESFFIKDVKVAFLLSSFSFILGTILAVMNTGAYSSNRLDISNIIKVICSIIRIIIVITLLKIFKGKIWFISASNIIEVSISILLGYNIFKRLIPGVSFSIHNFKLDKAKKLISSGCFNAIILMGTTLLSQVSLLVANRYIESMIVGIYSSILLIPNTLKNVASSVSSTFSPTTLEIYARGEMKELKEYSNNVVKFCGYVIGWPISIAAAMGVPVFFIWLGEDYSLYKYFFAFIMLHLVSNLAVSQLNVVQQAINKLKIPAIASILAGILNLILAVIFTGYYNMGLWGIGIASMISLTIRNSIFIPIYTAKVTSQKWYAYFKGIIKPQIIAIIVCIIGLWFESKFNVRNIWSLICVCSILSILYFIFVIITLTKSEKKFLFLKINDKIRNNTVKI